MFTKDDWRSYNIVHDNRGFRVYSFCRRPAEITDGFDARPRRSRCIFVTPPHFRVRVINVFGRARIGRLPPRRHIPNNVYLMPPTKSLTRLLKPSKRARRRRRCVTNGDGRRDARAYFWTPKTRRTTFTAARDDIFSARKTEFVREIIILHAAALLQNMRFTTRRAAADQKETRANVFRPSVRRMCGAYIVLCLCARRRARTVVGDS